MRTALIRSALRTALEEVTACTESANAKKILLVSTAGSRFVMLTVMGMATALMVSVCVRSTGQGSCALNGPARLIAMGTVSVSRI